MAIGTSEGDPAPTGGDPAATGGDPAAYGRIVGSDYDDLYLEQPDTLATVSKLAELAGSGGVLELGIGTGRIGLALVDAGVTVAGIEGSQLLADQLRAKPRGDEVDIVVGDFADSLVRGRFSVVLLAFNTIFALPSREAQVACFTNAARHMARGGCFVVEAFVLRGDQVDGRWSMGPRSVHDEHVELQIARYDPATHLIDRTLVHLTPAGPRFVSVTDNYAWPGELDLMARAAGLRLRCRWGGWREEQFGGASDKHVSVYEVDGE